MSGDPLPVYMPLAAPPPPAGTPPRDPLRYIEDRLVNALARAFGLPPLRQPDPRASAWSVSPGAPFAPGALLSAEGGGQRLKPGASLPGRTPNPYDFGYDALDLIAGFSPLAAVRDAATEFENARMKSQAGDALGAAGATGLGLLALAGIVPPGRAAAAAREAALLKRATDAARKADLATDEASRMQRRAAGGYTAGLWRGGTGPESGVWFTPDKAWATDFAARYGGTGDLREYAIRMGREFDARQTHSATELKPIADAIAKIDPKFAGQLIEHADDWGGRIPGPAVWYLMKQNLVDPFGPFARAGYDSINAGREVVALRRTQGQVRDANRAMFNPALRNSPNPFAAVLPPALTFGVLYPTLLSEERPR